MKGPWFDLRSECNMNRNSVIVVPKRQIPVDGTVELSETNLQISNLLTKICLSSQNHTHLVFH